MSISELIATVTDLQELRRMREELDAEIDALQDKIKAHMGDDERVTAGPYKITWAPVTTRRIDTKALTKDHPEIAEAYTTTTTTRRFTVS